MERVCLFRECHEQVIFGKLIGQEKGGNARLQSRSMVLELTNRWWGRFGVAKQEKYQYSIDFGISIPTRMDKPSLERIRMFHPKNHFSKRHRICCLRPIWRCQSLRSTDGMRNYLRWDLFGNILWYENQPCERKQYDVVFLITAC